MKLGRVRWWRRERKKRKFHEPLVSVPIFRIKFVSKINYDDYVKMELDKGHGFMNVSIWTFLFWEGVCFSKSVIFFLFFTKITAGKYFHSD